MANKVYVARETVISFKSSGGDATFTPASVATAAGRISAQYDRGSASKPGIYEWRARTRANSNPTIGNVLTVYLITSDGTYAEGDFATTDAGISTLTDLSNATVIGTVVADAASTTKDFVKAGLLWIRSRYIQVAWWNAFGQTLNTANDAHEFTLTPVPDEIQ